MYIEDCCSCSVYDDGFDRADSESLGPGWNSSSVSIESNKAKAVSAGAKAVTALESPSSNGVVQAVFFGNDYGDSIKLMISVANDENYIYALFKLATSAGQCGTIQLFEVLDGVETQIDNTRFIPGIEPDIAYTVRLCRGENILVATIIPPSTLGSDCVSTLPLTADGKKAGFEIASVSSEVTVDNFSFSRYGDTDSTCPKCSQNSCIIYWDFFQRSDRSEPGCGWEVVAGSAPITSNALVMSEAGSIVLSEAKAPDENDHLVVMAISLKTQAIAGTNTGIATGKIRAIANYTDSDNFWCAELKYHGGVGDPVFEMKLIKREGGTDTVLDQIKWVYSTLFTSLPTMAVLAIGKIGSEVRAHSTFRSPSLTGDYDLDAPCLIGETLPITTGEDQSLSVPAPSEWSLKSGIGVGDSTEDNHVVHYRLNKTVGFANPVPGSTPAFFDCCTLPATCGKNVCSGNDAAYYVQLDLDMQKDARWPNLHLSANNNGIVTFEEGSGSYLLEKLGVSISLRENWQGWGSVVSSGVGCIYGGSFTLSNGNTMWVYASIKDNAAIKGGTIDSPTTIWSYDKTCLLATVYVIEPQGGNQFKYINWFKGLGTTDPVNCPGINEEITLLSWGIGGNSVMYTDESLDALGRPRFPMIRVPSNISFIDLP